ncbi:PQQ-binding-like beta-propeller repeat protein [Streptomyces sp. NPDC002054]|uniref:protein kinase domain-containing protein n=1 Tax=Streptomyces sp. NPDC002054 TaxID=3154663 RepID=UPI003317CF76
MTLRDGDPRTIGGYVLIDRLGSGGMGTVYSARAASGRLVAVKLVHQQFADDPEFRTRFRQEVAAARRVSGAFTAPVVDADPDAPRPWMATQLVPGRTLGSRVKADGPLTGAELRMLAVGLVEALRELHTTGVIHRDLKPDNVLLTDDGPRVIDFGISRVGGQQTLTATGQILGTPPFMSPEQLSAPQRVAPASDVFSLGSVLVFAMTGRGPFDADSHYMTAYRVVSDPPELGGLPAGALRTTVEWCLAKDPADRPHPDELLAAFRDAKAAEWEIEVPVSIRDVAAEATEPSGPPTGPAGSGGRTVRSRFPRLPRLRRRTAVAAATAVALIAGAGIYLGFSQETSSGSHGGDGQEQVSPSDDSSEAEPKSRLPAYAAMAGGSAAGTAAYADPTDRRPKGWDAWVGAKGLGDCVYADSAAALVCTSTKATMPVSASGSGIGSVVRLDAATGQVQWSVKADVLDSESPAVVGDAVIVLGSGGKGFQAFDLGTGKSRWSVPNATVLRRLVVDGGRAYGVTAGGTVVAVDTGRGVRLWSVAAPKSDDGYPMLRAVEGKVYVQGRGQNAEMQFHAFVTTLDGATGRSVGHSPLAGPCETRGLTVAPVAAKRVFLCHRENGSGVLLGDPEKGAAWDIPYGGNALSPLSAADGKVYFMAASLSGEPAFTELNQDSGGSEWRVALPEVCAEPDRPDNANAVVVTDGLAYVRCGAEGRVIDLEAQEAVLKFTVPVRPEGPAGFLVAGGVVFAPSETGWASLDPQPM